MGRGKEFKSKRRVLLQNHSIEGGSAKTQYQTLPSGATADLAAGAGLVGSLAFDTTEDSVVVVKNDGQYAPVGGGGGTGDIMFEGTEMSSETDMLIQSVDALSIKTATSDFEESSDIIIQTGEAGTTRGTILINAGGVSIYGVDGGIQLATSQPVAGKVFTAVDEEGFGEWANVYTSEVIVITDFTDFMLDNTAFLTKVGNTVTFSMSSFATDDLDEYVPLTTNIIPADYRPNHPSGRASFLFPIEINASTVVCRIDISNNGDLAIKANAGGSNFGINDAVAFGGLCLTWNVNV